jgi:drug/metabolite transporter (DMT)-like permease
MNNWKSHTALLLANFLYGINYVVAKGIMPIYLSPMALVFLRIIPSTILFWLVSLGIKNEGFSKKEYLYLIAAGFFGVFLNQYLFIGGLNLSSPIDAAIIMTTNPIMVLVVAAIVLHERISTMRIGGIIVGAAGALLLVISKGFMGFKSQHMTGDILVFINSVSFAFYMVFAKPLMIKHNAVHVLKWTFLFGAIMYFPFGLNPFKNITWNIMPIHIIFAIIFVVFITTFLTYLLINYALKNLKSTTVSIYIYIQPVIAAITAILVGSDKLSLVNITASLLVFAGVYMVSLVNTK